MPNELSAKTVDDVVRLARAEPGKLTFGSGGVGSSNHLCGELFKSLAQVDIRHVPYRGVAQAIPDLLGGRLSMLFGNAPNVAPLVRDGKLRGLAVTSLKTSSVAPNLPTMAEAGFPAFNVTTWFGLLAPRGTPQNIIDKLHHETGKAAALPIVRDRLADLGIEVIANSPAEFAAIISSENSFWRKVIRKSGAVLNE